MSKEKLTPKEVLTLLHTIKAKVDNSSLSEYFGKIGINISANSIRAIKSNINR